MAKRIELRIKEIWGISYKVRFMVGYCNLLMLYCDCLLCPFLLISLSLLMLRLFLCSS